MICVWYELDLWWNALIKICVVKSPPFQLEREIGQGGFATVYETSDGYAAKVIEKSKIADKNRLLAFKSEIDLHRSMNHELIAKLHSVHDTGNEYVLKMEYFQGTRISEVAKSG